MIYILILLHYLSYIFIHLCFAAFIFSITKNKFIEYVSTSFLGLYALAELSIISYFLFTPEYNTLLVWYIWIIFVAVTILLSLILIAQKKMDYTMWIPFCLLFAPIIIVPIFIFLALFYSKLEKKNDNNEIPINKQDSVGKVEQ